MGQDFFDRQYIGQFFGPKRHGSEIESGPVGPLEIKGSREPSKPGPPLKNTYYGLCHIQPGRWSVESLPIPW